MFLMSVFSVQYLLFFMSMITSVYKTLCSINMHNMNVLMYVSVYDIY